MNETNSVTDHWCDAWCEFVDVAVSEFLNFDRRSVVDLGQNQVLFCKNNFEFLAKDLWVKQVLNTKTYSSGLVGIGWANAALGCALSVLSQIALS